MKLKLRRIIRARILLAVFLPMLVMTSLHVHPRQGVVVEDCDKCLNHQAHDGHFKVAQFSMHDCVLCQAFNLPFIVAAFIALSVFSFIPHTFLKAGRSHVVLGLKGTIGLRAPPSF